MFRLSYLKPEKKKMVICISGDYRSGKSGVGKCVAKKLKIPYYSMRKLKKQLNERYNTDYVDWNEILVDVDNKIIDEYIVKKAIEEDCILDFRFAALLCKEMHIPYIGVWIASSLDSRIYGNSYCWGKSKEEVHEIIVQREAQELLTCMQLYNNDYRKKEFYHYFIDLSKYWYPINEVVERGFLHDKEIDKLCRFIEIGLQDDENKGNNNG